MPAVSESYFHLSHFYRAFRKWLRQPVPTIIEAPTLPAFFHRMPFERAAFSIFPRNRRRAARSTRAQRLLRLSRGDKPAEAFIAAAHELGHAAGHVCRAWRLYSLMAFQVAARIPGEIYLLSRVTLHYVSARPDSHCRVALQEGC